MGAGLQATAPRGWPGTRENRFRQTCLSEFTHGRREPSHGGRELRVDARTRASVDATCVNFPLSAVTDIGLPYYNIFVCYRVDNIITTGGRRFVYVAFA